MNRKVLKGKAFLESKDVGSIFKKNKDLSNPDFDAHDISTFVVRKINPEYGARGTKVNCRRCTFAYEMRRRGYDVSATKTSNGRGQNFAGLYNVLRPEGEKPVRSGIMSTMTRMLKEYDSKTEEVSGPFSSAMKKFSEGLGEHLIESGESDASSAIFSALSKNPNGARGELGVTWKPGGGHSIAWEIVKGKAVIFDTQSGERFDSPEKLAASYGKNIAKAAFTRLDDKPLNEDFLLRWLKNAG